MAFIKLYIYDELGKYSHSRSGDADSAVDSAEMFDENFTLTPPPDYDQPWYWYDNKWQSEPKPTP